MFKFKLNRKRYYVKECGRKMALIHAIEALYLMRHYNKIKGRIDRGASFDEAIVNLGTKY